MAQRGSKCAKGFVLLAVLGLRVGSNRKKIAKQDDVYITGRSLYKGCKSHAQTSLLIGDGRRKVMPDPPTMPLAPRFGIAPKPVSRELAHDGADR